MLRPIIIGGLLPVMFCMQSCTSTDNTGFSYDPPGATVTTDKEIQPQYKRTIGSLEDGLWISNEFPGSRMNDFYKLNDSLYRIIIEPENHPVNNSPWYSFMVWADRDTTVSLQLSYRHGDHRYYPDISRNRERWTPVDSVIFREDTLNGTATLHLSLNRDTLYVGAQELITQSYVEQWADSLAQLPYVQRDTAGYSDQFRPIHRLTITDVPEETPAGILILISRLHPPETTGNQACFAFIEEIANDSQLSERFRRQFKVIAYPFANPDGVQNGHWRHNANGVDLNRDWTDFNQPETKAIRDDLLQTVNSDSMSRVFYGIDFHSTDEYIFYPIDRDVKTFPDDLTYRWLDTLTASFPGIHFKIEPYDVSSPIAKNWIYNTFGADALTYEVHDRADRDSLRMVARKGAQQLMQLLLEEKDKMQ